MQRDPTRLRQALKNPADGPYAVTEMRELLLEALSDWPLERYQVADYFLPHGRLIRTGARKSIDGLLVFLDSKETGAVNDLLKNAKMIELLCN